MPLHEDTFTHRNFYAEKPLREATLAHKAFTEKRLHADAFTLHREVFKWRSLYIVQFYTQELCKQKSFRSENRAAFPEGHLYPQMLLHTVASEKPLHIDAWTQRSFCAQKAFTETGFYTGKLTNRCLYKQKLLHRETFTNISLLHREAFARRRL